jgi:hypothetical protein
MPYLPDCRAAVGAAQIGRVEMGVSANFVTVVGDDGRFEALEYQVQCSDAEERTRDAFIAAGVPASRASHFARIHNKLREIGRFDAAQRLASKLGLEA